MSNLIRHWFLSTIRQHPSSDPDQSGKYFCHQSTVSTGLTTVTMVTDLLQLLVIKYKKNNSHFYTLIRHSNYQSFSHHCLI